MGIVSSRPTITRKELEGVLDCLIHDELDRGTTVKNFEARLADMYSLKFSLALNSLTAAYHLAFRALEIAPGDEVIIPSFFSRAPLAALGLVGGRAVLVDCEEGSYCPSEAMIREKISDRTRAVLFSQMFGFFSDSSYLKDIKIPVIEDISHAIGFDPGEPPYDLAGTIVVASFAPSMMITTGNGGLVMTSNSRLYSVMKDLRNGDDRNTPGYEYTMTDFQAAMGVSQLLRLAQFVKRRREIARMYYDALKMTTHRTFYAYGEGFVYQSFPVIFDATEDRIDRYWKKTGIELTRPVKTPLHTSLELKPMDYPNSERLCKKLYTLPLYPALSKKEIEKISRSLANFI